MVEGGAAALAAERATEEQVAYLAELVEQMDDQTDFHAWGDTDSLFHLILADAAGSQRVVTAVAELRSRVYHVSSLWDKNPISTLKLSNRQHRAIVRAVKARQPERARKAMVEHVESTLAIWLGLQSQLRARSLDAAPPAAARSGRSASPSGSRPGCLTGDERCGRNKKTVSRLLPRSSLCHLMVNRGFERWH